MIIAISLHSFYAHHIFRLAIRNTEVLKFLGDVVPQFRVLCFVLRKWASSVDVSGNVNSGPKLTHYSLYMLIWFYIRSKLNLPSFEDLSRLLGSLQCLHICSMIMNLLKSLNSSQKKRSMLTSGIAHFLSIFLSSSKTTWIRFHCQICLLDFLTSSKTSIFRIMFCACEVEKLSRLTRWMDMLSRLVLIY